MSALDSEMYKPAHPSEETLEEYIFGRLPEAQLEGVETHIFACESCVDTLERVELHLRTMKLALQGLAHQQGTSESTAKGWFRVSIPCLSWVPVAALIAFCVSPGHFRPPLRTTEIQLHAYRGLDVPVLPQHRALSIILDTADLPHKTLAVQVVGEYGREIWTGSATVTGDKTKILVPAFSANRSRFLRLYDGPTGQTDRLLLREFAFRVE